MDFFDLHCDTLTRCYRDAESLCKNSADVDLDRGKIFGRWNQTFAVFIPDDMDESYAERYFDSVYDFYLSELERFGGYRKILSGREVCSGARGALLAMENSKAVSSLERLERLCEKGLRLLGLTWNGKNRAAGGCHDGGGLSEWGRELVKKAQRLGIVVDVSHLSDRAFYDVTNISEMPIIASHSNARAVCDNPRCLCDEQIKTIIEQGGLIGLNFCRKFLGLQGTRAQLLRHARHILSLGGENVLSIGSDYDGCEMSKEFGGIEKIPSIYVYFEENGIPEELCRKIFFENASLFFEKVLHNGHDMI